MRSIKILPIFLLFPFLSFGWNGNGHSTCGAVAYYYLKANNPVVIQKVLTILKSHPWYNNAIWTDKLAGLTGEQREVSLFMLASTFPDDARDSTLGNGIKTHWHYVDYPFVPAGQTVTGTPPPDPNAEERINELLVTIPKETNGSQKAIDVCWLFHLIEDIHQPLHASMLFNSNNPTGDGGGNLTYFRQPASGAVQKLHSYWDGLVYGTFATIPASAQALLNNPQFSQTNLTELLTGPTVHDWIVNESFVLAVHYAYLNGALNGTYTKPSTIPTTYPTVSLAVAQRRVVLAGIRLGNKLVEVL